MNSCIYPSCMMGGAGCPDESKCDEVAEPVEQPINCTTHSHACDCREEGFRKLEADNKILIEALEWYVDNVFARDRYSEKINSHVTDKVAREALAKIKEQ